MYDDEIKRAEDGSLSLFFKSSTIETIDRAVFKYISELELFVSTNAGFTRVPVIWATAERSYQVKKSKDLRDGQGMLKMPIITVARTAINKSLASKGAYQGNIPELEDEQGGALPTSRVLYQEKTLKFANADAKRLNGQLNFPRCNAKIVHRTISAPMPVNVNVDYEITLRTEYQQQMNDLLQPFITLPGTINYITLSEGSHKYEGFIQESFQSNSNLSDFSSEERKFETKITLQVVGYLIGEGKNRVKPHFSVRENVVEVKIPRERVSLQEVPEHEYGSYYGLAGLPSAFSSTQCPTPDFFGNVPAAGASTGEGAGSGGGSVTITNFSNVLSDHVVVRKLVKSSDEVLAGSHDRRTFVVEEPLMKLNTESVYVNGLIVASGANDDYTMDGNTIKFTDGFGDILDTDSIYITYIKA